MLYGENRQNEKPHGIILENRSKMTVTGVTDVECFDENEIIIHTTQGILAVSGEGIHMEKLNTDAGDVVVLGVVSSMRYEEKRELRDGLFKRIFR